MWKKLRMWWARCGHWRRKEWRHPLPKANVLLRPLAVAGGLAFVTDTSADGVIAHLLALDLHTGQATWDLPRTLARPRHTLSIQ